MYGAEYHQKIVVAAAQIIADEGLSHFSLRTVARKVGVSTTVIYSLIGNREDLIEAVSREARGSFVREQRAVGCTENVLVDLKNLGRAYRRWSLENPALYSVMFGGYFGPQEIDREPIAPLADAVHRIHAQGRLKIEDPWQAVWAFWSAVHGATTLEIAGGCVMVGGQSEESFEVILEGMVRGLVSA